MTGSAFLLSGGGGAGGGSLVTLAESQLGSAQSSIDLQGIPPDYAHLLIECYIRRVSDTGDVFLRFNGDSGSNYSWRERYSYSGGTGVNTGNGDTGIFGGTMSGSGDIASSFGVVSFRVPNYAGSGKKACIWHSFHLGAMTGHDSFLRDGGGFWNNTDAIDQITIVAQDASNLDTGSRVTVYGMAGMA